MRNRNYLIFLLLLVSAGPALSQTGGYFSLDYNRGQEESAVPEGMFLGLEAGIIFNGSLSERFEYVSEFSIQADSPLRVEQAVIGYRLAEALIIKAGLFPVPFGEYNEMNRPFLTQLINPPLHSAGLLPYRWRDMGLLVEGETRGFYYAAYIGNGLGEAENLNQSFGFVDNNKDKSRGGKVKLSLGSGLDVAYSTYWGKYDDQNTRQMRMSALNAVWKADFIYVLYERIWASLENPMDIQDGEGKGDLVLVAVSLDSFQPFASYQKMTYQDEFHGYGFNGENIPGLGISEDKTRWTAGVVYHPAHGVRLKIEYDWNLEEGLELNDNILCFQVAVVF